MVAMAGPWPSQPYGGLAGPCYPGEDDPPGPPIGSFP